MSAPMGPESVDRAYERRSARLRFALTAVAGVLLLSVTLAVTVVVWDWLARGDGDSAHRAVGAENTAPREESDIAWVDVAGVALPVSRTHGPRITTRGRAAGYSHSELGAAYAAVHVLIRTSATSGPRVFEPVLAEQVTGGNVGKMKLLVAEEYDQLRAQYHVPEGEPIPAGDARVLGFRISTYDPEPGRAWVDIVLSSAGLGAPTRVVAFEVQLRWAGDDWRVVAPPDGDWSTRATLLGSPPAGTVPYGAVRGRG